MRRREYEERLKELNRQIEELKNVSIEEDGVWKPTFGEKYWVVDINGEVCNDFWDGYDSEINSLNIGNIFKTEQEAKNEVERRKVLVELKQFSREFKNGEENHYITFYDNLKLDYTCDHYQNRQGTLYFESRGKLEEAVEAVGEDRIKKYIFGIK